MKSCPTCGSGELKKTGTIQKDGITFAAYRCMACDTECSAYQKYQKEIAAARKTAQEIRAKVNSTSPPTASATSTASAAPQKKVESLTHAAAAKPVAPRPASAAPQKAQAKATPSASKPSVFAPSATPIPQPPVVNVAAAVYKKAINSTVAIVAKRNGMMRCGTGTMLSDGYLLTNAHVVMELSPDRKTVLGTCQEIYGKSGKTAHRFSAELVYSDPQLDLALLKTAPHATLIPVTLEQRPAEPGEDVYAIGNSKGEGLCIVEGIVSDVDRRVGGNEYVMISAPVTNGNSGGPVFNVSGNLIGIVQSGRSDVSAMNYAIPVNVIQAFLAKAKK